MKRLLGVLFTVVTIATCVTVASAESQPPSPTLPMTFKTSLTPGYRYFFTFRLFDAATGGTELWTETTPVRLTVSSTRTIQWTLGSVIPFTDGPAGPVDFSQQLWVQFSGGGRTFARVKLGVVPYAMWSASTGQGVCLPGDFVNCYEGAIGTLGVGPCKSGLRRCSEAGNYLGTSCSGQNIPQTEECNGTDDDCNGQVDDGVTCLLGGDVCFNGRCVACTEVPGGCLSTATITFAGVVGGTPFTSYIESSFTVSSTLGSWVATAYENIGFSRTAADPAIEGEIRITAGGSTFTFSSVDLYSSLTPIPYTFTGFKNSELVFMVSDTEPPTLGTFSTVPCSKNNDLIDSLLIRLTNPATPAPNPMGIDNIVLRH